MVATARVTGNYFDVLGVPAAIGRVFTPGDNVTEGAHPYAVLSWDLWHIPLDWLDLLPANPPAATA